ncbi:MAG: hypothetical protein K2L11_11830 [Muribaculaceae bacterium]|nr:hypothetical protein [Muribaculaceae bacterium]
MKKTLMILALTGGMFLTSCDPQKAEGVFESTTMTTESLMNGATFAQFDLVDGKYVPSETGNYIQYNFPGVQAVNIYYMKGNEKKTLSYGRSGGIFYYMPARGSELLQTLYFSYLNADGTEVVAEKQFTLEVAQALDPAVKVLVSDDGSKKWKWMPTNANEGAVWGNGGYLAGEQDGSLNINGAWWGCGVLDGTCKDTFESQTAHAGSRWPEVQGECYALSYMEFLEDGSLIAYSPEGAVINEGSFSIKNYNNNQITNADNSSRGTLETSEGAILWPFAINTNGMQPTAFEIGWLDPSRMILLYAAEGTEAWKECTWWSFMSDDDPEVLAVHDWHWKPTSVNAQKDADGNVIAGTGAVWGNGGYLAGSQNGTGEINGAWWGCGVNDGGCADTFASQMGHAGAAYVEGEEYSESKMVFNVEDASVTVYGKDGNELRSGSFSIDLTPNPAKFSIGTLNTSEGAILWPFAINTGGHMPTSFEIGYMGPESLILIYAPEGTEAWKECTWWSFGK